MNTSFIVNETFFCAPREVVCCLFDSKYDALVISTFPWKKYVYYLF